MHRRISSLLCLAVIAMNGLAEAAAAAHGAFGMIAARQEPAAPAAPISLIKTETKACHAPKTPAPAAASCSGGCGHHHALAGAHACCCGKAGALAGKAGSPCISGVPCRPGDSGGEGANLPPSLGLRFLLPGAAELANPLGLAPVEIFEESFGSVALTPVSPPPRTF